MDATALLEDLAAKLLEDRVPTIRSVRVLTPIAGGYTDAVVAACDVVSVDAAVHDLSGQFVLKAQRSDAINQADAHDGFCERLRGFAARHVPALRAMATDDDISVALYDVAG